MRGKKLIKNLLALSLVFSTWGIFGFHSGDLEDYGGNSQAPAAGNAEMIIQNTALAKNDAIAEAVEPPPSYSVIAEIDTKKQTMTVRRDGAVLYVWKVSTGRRGFNTPGGNYRPERMHTMWYSKKYDNAPMPYAIFFHGGYAIHGTTAIGRLGSAASHGCVRLATGNAREFFKLVTAAGVNRTQIIVN